MSTAAGVSLDQYLSTHYEPECELIDGELVPKPMGTRTHSRIQFRLQAAIIHYEAGSDLEVAGEISVRHGNDVRIPDVTVYRSSSRFYRDILDEPPILCVEIVSPSQSPSDLFVKCQTYHAWGVPFCWVVDPVKRTAWEFHANAKIEPVVEVLRAGKIEVTLDEIFRIEP